MEEGKKKGASTKKKTDYKSKILTNNLPFSQIMKNKIDPFKKKSKMLSLRAKEDFFVINYEDSQTAAANSSTVDENSHIQHAASIFKKPKKVKRQKNNINDIFNVDFEESNEVLSQDVPSVPQLSSQKSLNDSNNQDTTINFKQLALFKNPKGQSNHAFKIDLEESGHTLTQNTQSSQASSTSSQRFNDVLSQEEAEKHSLFQNQKKQVNNVFDIDFEESKDISSENGLQSLSQKSNDSTNQNTTLNFEEPKLFNNPKLQSNNAINIDLEGTQEELSQDLPTATPSLSQKSNDSTNQNTSINFEEPKLFNNPKLQLNNTFDIDLEGTQEESSQDLPTATPSLSQKSNDSHTQDTSISFKKHSLFKNTRLQSTRAFDVDLEETGQTLTQNTQSSQASSTSSQRSTDVLSQGESEKRSLFQNRKGRVDAFYIDFEESKDVSSHDVLSVPQSSQKSTCSNNQDTTINFKQPKLFNNSKLESNHVFDIDLEESGQVLTQNTQSSQASTASSQKSIDSLSQDERGKGSLFENKKKSVDNAFDVDFEESRNITDVLGTSRTTPTKSNVLPFRKLSHPKEHDFDVNFNVSNTETNVDGLTEKSVNGPVMSCASPTTKCDSFTTEENPMNASEACSDFNQSSFNDENLRQWMSDESEDEIEIEDKIDRETNRRSTLTPNDIPAPPGTIAEEDHMQRLQLKLKEIIDSARNGEVQIGSPVICREKVADQPKRVQSKPRVSAQPRLRKPAPFATKRLYNYIIGKIKPKYGMHSALRAEELIIFICNVVKIVLRRKGYQKKLINDLKVEMARMDVIDTTYEFYEFVREFLPYEFRLKVVPCIQPGTNIVYPPKDATNPFESIF